MIRLAAFAIVLSLAVACVSDDEEPTPSATPESSETATITETPPTGPVQVVIDEPLPVYMVPLTDSPAIGDLPGGTTVTVIVRHASWLALEGYGWVWPSRALRDSPKLVGVPWGAIPLSFAAHADPPETGVAIVDELVRAVVDLDDGQLLDELTVPEPAGRWLLFAVVERELPEYEVGWEAIFKDGSGSAFSLLVESDGATTLTMGDERFGVPAVRLLLAAVEDDLGAVLIPPPVPAGLIAPEWRLPSLLLPVEATVVDDAPVYYQPWIGGDFTLHVGRLTPGARVTVIGREAPAPTGGNWLALEGLGWVPEDANAVVADVDIARLRERSAQFSYPAHLMPPPSGDPFVDEVAAMVTSGSADALFEVLRFESLPCEETSGYGPFCPEGVEAGEEVEAFPVGLAYSEGGFLRTDESRAIVTDLLSDDWHLFAVVRALDGESEEFRLRDGSEQVVFQNDAGTSAFSLELLDGGVISLVWANSNVPGGGWQLAQIYIGESSLEGEFLVRPPLPEGLLLIE